ncbi:MAG: hypothetical protein JSS91_11860 [Bacteroidetes bacterium]|nr:hypothetical protein [Bacteroidota bacterium]
MNNSKLIQVLKTFSARELKLFRDFTRSPVYNKNKNVISLFDILKKYHPDFDSSKIGNETVYKKLFPGENYDYFKLKNIASDLLSVCKEFLKFLSFSENEHLNNKFLLEQYRDRDLDRLYEQLYKNYTDNLEKIKVKDEFYYSKMAEMTNELKSFVSPKKPNSDFELFQTELEYEINLSLIKILDLYSTMLHEIKQNNYSYDLKMFDEVMEYLSRNNENTVPILQMYYYIILLQTKKDEKIFLKLKEFFKNNFENMDHYHKYMYFLHMSGFCAEMYNFECRTDYMKEHFYLSKDNFDKGTITMGKILYMDFLNHVKIAVRVNEYEWAENYIEKFKDRLSEERESTLDFCNGVIEYSKGNRLKALDLFSRTSFPNYIIKLQVKLLMLRIFYEEGFYDQALAAIDSFRHFLSRENSIKENYRESFSDFLKITGELIRLKLSVNNHDISSDLKRLKAETEKSTQNQFGIKLWLFEMIRNFK